MTREEEEEEEEKEEEVAVVRLCVVSDTHKVAIMCH